MASWGIIPSDTEGAASMRISAVIVGTLRDEYGCSGPKGGACPHSFTVPLVPDPNVPLLKRSVDDKQDHRYI